MGEAPTCVKYSCQKLHPPPPPLTSRVATAGLVVLLFIFPALKLVKNVHKNLRRVCLKNLGSTAPPCCKVGPTQEKVEF